MIQQVRSINPVDGQKVYEAAQATADEVVVAVKQAEHAWQGWSLTPMDDRIGLLRLFQEAAQQRLDELADIIRLETGKTRSESLAEAKLLPAKIDATLDAWSQRCATQTIEGPTTAVMSYHALGVLAVLGPFNFPMHLPHGHIAPAILAGNSVVFKPSEKTPGSGAMYASLWKQAGIPEGVLQVVQGDREVATALIDQPAIAGVLFTGSYRAGQALSRRLADRPEVLLALEMGGNNPLVVHDPDDVQAAAKVAAQSAYITSGQRCTCARRIIITGGPRVRPFVDALLEETKRLTVGPGDADPEPTIGPVISAEQGRAVQAAQQRMIDAGSKVLIRMEKRGENDAMLSPGLLDATGIPIDDEETFGPLAVLVRVGSLDHAIAEANRTRFGLSASLLCRQLEAWNHFRGRIRAGVVNWNLPTTGASGRLPFGGIGRSGNHRPAGFHSVDYCCFAMASVERETLV